MFKKIFNKNQKNEQSLTTSESTDKARLLRAITNLGIAPIKLITDIISNAFWVLLSLLFCCIIIAFVIPQIREVVVSIIVRELSKIS